jgi:hypothetical protein
MEHILLAALVQGLNGLHLIGDSANRAGMVHSGQLHDAMV